MDRNSFHFGKSSHFISLYSLSLWMVKVWEYGFLCFNQIFLWPWLDASCFLYYPRSFIHWKAYSWSQSLQHHWKVGVLHLPNFPNYHDDCLLSNCERSFYVINRKHLSWYGTYDDCLHLWFPYILCNIVPCW